MKPTLIIVASLMSFSLIADENPAKPPPDKNVTVEITKSSGDMDK